MFREPTNPTNLARAIEAWGTDMPRWVRILADACDRMTQRGAAEKLGVNSGTTSRLLARRYGASCDEMERKVLATFAGDTVACPLAGTIALKTCLRNRRRTGPAINFLHHEFARACPACPNNNDRSGQ